MPYQVVVTFEDITKRKQFEEKLKHFNNLMQYIISHAKSAIAILDKNMKYVYVSERFLKDYNLTDTNIIGKNHYDIFTDLSEKWLESHKKGLNGEITGSEEEAFYRADG
jgi:PAS domain-containing protein